MGKYTSTNALPDIPIKDEFNWREETIQARLSFGPPVFVFITQTIPMSQGFICMILF